MGATSHDFWLRTLTAPAWKALHMGVYLAYTLIDAIVDHYFVVLEKQAFAGQPANTIRRFAWGGRKRPKPLTPSTGTST